MFPEIAMIFFALMHVWKKEQKYAHILAMSVLLVFLGVLLKKLMSYTNLSDYILRRPVGAFGCNGDSQASCENEVAMPSIHSMLAGYYTVKFNSWLFIFIALSRLGKKENPFFYHSKSGCHTVPQITVGFCIGSFLAKVI